MVKFFLQFYTLKNSIRKIDHSEKNKILFAVGASGYQNTQNLTKPGNKSYRGFSDF